MMNWLDTSRAIDDLTAPDTLWGWAVDTFGAGGFGAVISLSSNADRTSVTLRTNAPELYENMAPEKDPFLEHCCRSYDITRVGAGYIPRYDYLDDSAKTFIERCASIGFMTGFGIPVRLEGSSNFGGFILGSTLDLDAFEGNHAGEIDALRTFCLLLHRRFEELTSEASIHLQGLSPREIDVISQVVEGATRKEIARALGLSPNTVAEYTKSAYRKLGVRNGVKAARKLAG